MDIKSAVLNTIAKKHPNFIPLTQVVSESLLLLDINRINYPKLFKQVNSFILENSTDSINPNKILLFKRGFGIKLMPTTIRPQAISL
jgi:hypothetical protein